MGAGIGGVKAVPGGLKPIGNSMTPGMSGPFASKVGGMLNMNPSMLRPQPTQQMFPTAQGPALDTPNTMYNNSLPPWMRGGGGLG